MKNIYITSIPLQGKEGLQKVNYVPQDEIKCDPEMETCFPIIPVIKATKNDEVENKIVVVQMKNPDTNINLDLFKKELSEIGINEECITLVELEEDSSYATGTNMFLSVMSTIENDSDVYACITFGTKVVSLIISYVLVSIKDLFHNTYVKSVCYGEIPRDKGAATGAKIWDVKRTIDMCEIVRNIATLHMENPLKMLNTLFEGK